VLVCETGREVESKNRLARIGFDNVVGHLGEPAAVFVTAPDEVAISSRLTVEQFDQARNSVAGLQVVDIRQPGETGAGVIDGAILIPLTLLNQQLSRLDASKPAVVYCAGGYRSSIAASKMMAAGFADVSDLLGGYGAWETAHQRELSTQ
jgi:hydroxyacylglutathione hydrolase